MHFSTSLLFDHSYKKYIYHYIIKKRKQCNNVNQISANRGANSRFVLESSLKSLWPKSSRSSILKTKNGVQSKHDYQPGSNSLDYHHSYTNTDSCNDLFSPNVSSFVFAYKLTTCQLLYLTNTYKPREILLTIALLTWKGMSLSRMRQITVLLVFS